MGTKWSYIIGFIILLCQNVVSTADNTTIFVTSDTSSPCLSYQCQDIACPCPSIQAALDAIESIGCNSSIVTISLLSGVYIGNQGNQNLQTNLKCPVHITYVNYKKKTNQQTKNNKKNRSFNQTLNAIIILTDSMITNSMNSIQDLQLSYLTFQTQNTQKSPLFYFGNTTNCM